jgi:dTDP-4-dehydrorhamnose 3,5-epimerase
MKFSDTEISGVKLIEPEVYGDQRGFFMETWQARDFAAAGIGLPFVQDNQSRSVQGTLRGLHYQLPQPQGKLVRVVVGEIFDVAVDLRVQSPSFGKWAGFTLSEANRRMLWVPPGCAHGFYVISEFAEMVYKCSDYYAPTHEHAIRWDDPELAIDWPLPESKPPLLSAKDAGGKFFKEAVLYP